jgi:hypothetical protein
VRGKVSEMKDSFMFLRIKQVKPGVTAKFAATAR